MIIFVGVIALVTVVITGRLTYGDMIQNAA